MSGPRIRSAGDAALVAEFEERIDPAVNARVAALARLVANARIAGVRDIVPTFRSLAVYYDPALTDIDALSKFLETAANETEAGPSAKAGDPIRVPVQYGGEDGPDLGAVAAFAGMSPDEVISAHAERVYRVYMLGFVPGFAYMATVDPRIAMPRLEAPRTRVPAGSVAIAGAQTSVYPADTPGGWRLIGRTVLRPFDLARPQPFLFQPGDHVQFYPARESR